MGVSFIHCIGLLQRDQESAVVYGSIDTGKNIKAHDKFKELVSVY